MNDVDHGDVCRKGANVRCPGDCAPVDGAPHCVGAAGAPCRSALRPVRDASCAACADARWAPLTGVGKRTMRKRRNAARVGAEFVVSHCSYDLGWLADAVRGLRTAGVDVEAITVYSKCGFPVRNAPNGSVVRRLPNVGRCDHTYARHLGHPRRVLRPLVFLLKDSSLAGSRADFRALSVDLPSLAAAALSPTGLGFGCGRVPDVDGSAWHETSILKTFGGVAEHHHAWEQRAANGSAPAPYFKYANLRAFVDAYPPLGAALRVPVVPVCYGGTFAVARDRVAAAPREVWRALEAALSRGDNIEEGSFVERLWAPLLARRAPDTLAVALLCAARRRVEPPRSYAGMLRDCACAPSELGCARPGD